MLQAPVIMSENGLGALDVRHPLAQTMQVGNDLWPSVDVALAVGTRFFHPIVEWGRDDGVRLIRIDIDPTQSVAAWPPDVHIVADARAALAALLDRVSASNLRRANREDEFAQMKAAKEEALGQILAPQRAYTKVIRNALAEDGIVCFDVTQLHFYSWWGYPAYRPRTVIQPGYQGTLGYGYPTALGAKVALPDRPVIYVGGDGGFMFNCQELATAMRFRIAVVAIVFNDHAYGNVRREAERNVWRPPDLLGSLQSRLCEIRRQLRHGLLESRQPGDSGPRPRRGTRYRPAGLHRSADRRLSQPVPAHVLPQGTRLNGCAVATQS